METLITTHSVSYLNHLSRPVCSISRQSSQCFRPSAAFISVQRSVQLKNCCNAVKTRRRFGGLVIVRASAAQSKATTDVDDGESWLLEPVGNGDYRHIGYKVALPPAFEIASSEVTIGRVPEKADIVIPVATVSGMHARIQKKGGDLWVTDLDSTNGTFIDEKRLTPGVPCIMPPGRYLTFGDTNLAIFRVSKLESVKPTEESETEGSSSVVENANQNS